MERLTKGMLPVVTKAGELDFHISVTGKNSGGWWRRRRMKNREKLLSPS